MNGPLLVTNASGLFGRRVIHHLTHTLRVPAGLIVATCRDPANLYPLVYRGVVARRVDPDDEAQLIDTFRGMARILLIGSDADRPELTVQQRQRAISAAAQAGVQHLIYTSVPYPAGSPVLHAQVHAATEAAIEGSSLPGWTLLRNHRTFEAFFTTLPTILAQQGVWFSAAGDGRMADIGSDDLALAAACELTSFSQGKHTYTLSGLEATTTAEQAQLVGAVLGRRIQVIPVEAEDLVRALLGAGHSRDDAQLIASFDRASASGHRSHVSHDFQRLTDRPPITIAKWLARNLSAITACKKPCDLLGVLPVSLR
ncbi:MAG: NmrA family NAD(P)-binding protein [Steroidobacteraceae bacterium]